MVSFTVASDCGFVLWCYGFVCLLCFDCVLFDCMFGFSGVRVRLVWVCACCLGFGLLRRGIVVFYCF